MPSITFTGCDLLGADRARARTKAPARGTGRAKPTAARGRTSSAGRRREIVVGGRRVKVIDVHAHCVIPAAYDLLGLKVDDHRGPGIGEVGERRIREMDAQGIDMEALSINPRWYRTERDVVTRVIKIQNERLAEEAKDLIDSLPGAEGFMCDVSKDEDIDRTFAALKERYGKLHVVVHSVAFAPAAELEGEFINTSREGFRVAHDGSAKASFSISMNTRPSVPKRR